MKSVLSVFVRLVDKFFDVLNVVEKNPSLSYLSVRQEEALVFISWQEGGFSIKASCPSHLLRIRRMGRRDNTHKKN